MTLRFLDRSVVRRPARVAGPGLALSVAMSVAIALSAVTAVAQEPEQFPAPPHLSLIEGVVDLDREGQVSAPELGLILAAGDRLRTGAGRLEILFGDGSALHLDEATTVDLLDEGLVRLLSGRVFLHVTASDEPLEYRIDTPAAMVTTDVAGEYRLVAADDGTAVTEVAVARGLALVTAHQDSLALRAGERVVVRAGSRPGYPVAFNAADWTAFDRWSYERRHGYVQPYSSALPSPLYPYAGTLASHGTWSQDPAHGFVWYPRVAVGWRPFYHGRWTSIAPYGWTWIGVDAWSWPTHHYGSWGVTTAGVWFWIPGRHWRPAAVHWTITAGHIGWVPWGVGSIARFGFTVVPRTVFAVNVVVPRHALRAHTITPVLRTAGIQPPLPRVAVPRAFAGRRAASDRVVVASGARQDRSPSRLDASRTAMPRASARTPLAGSTDTQNDGRAPRATVGDAARARNAGSAVSGVAVSRDRQGLEDQGRGTGQNGRAQIMPRASERSSGAIGRDSSSDIVGRRRTGAPTGQAGSGRVVERRSATPRAGGSIEAGRTSREAASAGSGRAVERRRATPGTGGSIDAGRAPGDGAPAGSGRSIERRSAAPPAGSARAAGRTAREAAPAGSGRIVERRGAVPRSGGAAEAGRTERQAAPAGTGRRVERAPSGEQRGGASRGAAPQGRSTASAGARTAAPRSQGSDGGGNAGGQRSGGGGGRRR